MFRLGVVGDDPIHSRRVRATLDLASGLWRVTYLLGFTPSHISTTAREWAVDHDIAANFLALPKTLNQEAAPRIRNDLLLTQADALVVFWKVGSRDIGDLLEKARRLHIDMLVLHHA